MTKTNELDRTADRVRDAFVAAAAVIAAETPPLSQFSAPRRPRVVRRPHGWMIPLAAAATVVAIVLGSVAVAGRWHRPAASGERVDTAAGPPEYAALEVLPKSGPYQLQIRRTSDGAVTATWPDASGYYQPTLLTASASDRDFFTREITGTCPDHDPLVTRFVRITINAAGQIRGESQVGGPVSGEIQHMAVSPDGTQMAYTTMFSSPGCQRTDASSSALHMMNLATGAVRTWPLTLTLLGSQRGLGSNALTWRPDGSGIVLSYEWMQLQNSPAPVRSGWGALSLAADAPGGSLTAHSQLLRTMPEPASCADCSWQILAGPGTTLISLSVHATGTGSNSVIHLLVTRLTGHQQTVMYRATALPRLAFGLTISSDPSGQHLLLWGRYARPSPPGLISGGRLVPLPGLATADVTSFAW